MKYTLLVVALIIILSAFMQTDNSKTFRQLYTLEGTWMMKTTKGFIGEEWIKIDNNYLQNRGFMIKGNDTVVTERVALRNNKNGIFYTSTVSDENSQQPIAFKLTSVEKNVFTFENPTHDFPKRITYHLVSKDSLYAWIDGGPGDSGKKSAFGYHRVK